MLVTLFGIVTLVRPLQLENAQSPILVTLFGIVMLVTEPVDEIKTGEYGHVPRPFTMRTG
jgi:hypothetical protein